MSTSKEKKHRPIKHLWDALEMKHYFSQTMGFFFFQPAPIKQEEKENIALKMTASHSTESHFRKSLESHKTIRREQM